MRLLPAQSFAIHSNIALRLLAFIRIRLAGRVSVNMAEVAAVDKDDKRADEQMFLPTASTGVRRVLAISTAGRQSAGLFGKPTDLRGMGRMTVDARTARANPTVIPQTRPGFAHSTAHAPSRIVIIR